jgi:vancomycin resistance protein YoaR
MPSLLKKSGEQNKKPFLWLLYSVAVFFILADITAAGYLIFKELYKNKIYPGVRIGNIELGGKTGEEAKKEVEAEINEINQNGVKFKFENNEAAIMPIISSFGGDIARALIAFDAEETVNRAFSVGREKNFFVAGFEQLDALGKGRRIPASFTVQDEEIKKILALNLGKFEEPPRDAGLYATTTPNYWKKEIIFKISEESPGFRLDYGEAVDAMKKNLENFDSSPVKIAAVKGYPSIRKNECLNIETLAAQFLDKAELTLISGDKKWPVEKESIAGWLSLSRGIGGKIVIDLDAEKVRKFLEEKIAPEIETNPVNARFEIKDGRVVEFVSSRNGQKIDFEKTFQKLRTDFIAGQKNTAEISMKEAKSEIETGGVNGLGITEIVGTGHSNFSGSPKNRIHNINVGAASLNGLLIAPGAEFSTDKELGIVDASTGYLPEMTIKGNKTVPEYGGGLCQIGTTVFRAALASGFPITARQPHSYRVVYYEPAGTDATIYQPWPDLRFINDSPNYILIQTHISGNDLYFDFWGTKDGRVVEQTDPVIYNIIKPGPTKIVETLDMTPGQKKCTERAHNGADAYFDYKVTYPDGTVKENRFKSHYVPWREVCLLGVKELSATSTPAKTQ